MRLQVRAAFAMIPFSPRCCHVVHTRSTLTHLWCIRDNVRVVYFPVFTNRVVDSAIRFRRRCPLPFLAIQFRSVRHSCPTLEASRGLPVVMASERTKRSSGKRRALSLEDALLRQVNSLAGERNAAVAVQTVRAALQGIWVPPDEGNNVIDSGASAAYSPGSISASRLVFSTKAFAAALFACEASGDAASGLSLVEEVRQYYSRGISAEWLKTEHVLSVILRLQCMAGDRDGATHMFAYLEQHGLLRLRSVSALLQYSCGKLKDRRLAFAVYEVALKHKMSLTEPDYVALGLLCVQVREPISTLFFMLNEMRQHIAEVSEKMVRDVLGPWVRIANDDAAAHLRNRGPQTSVFFHTVDTMRHALLPPAVSLLPSAVDSREVAATLTGAQLSGFCPVCQVQLSGYPFTASCRAHLLRELTEVIIPQACRSRRALLGFEHWKRYIHARLDAGDRVDVFIDGANLGYYGLSSWYHVAKKQLMLHRGMKEGQITEKDLEFNAQCKAPGRCVDVSVNFELVNNAVNLAVNAYGLSRPLVMLHERHVDPAFMTSQSAALVQEWSDRGWVYCTPRGLNDDLCWLYGALLLTDPADVTPTSLTTDAVSSHRTFVCTNDKMRDHHFRLLSPRAFTRWRDQHRIGFRCVRLENRTELLWEMPALYERCIQRYDVHSAPSQDSQERKRTCLHNVAPHMTSGAGSTAATDARTITSWHIPYTPAPQGAVTSDMCSIHRNDKRGQNILVPNVKDEYVPHHHPASLPKMSEDENTAATECTAGGHTKTTEEGHSMPPTPVTAGPWVCITLREKSGSG